MSLRARIAFLSVSSTFVVAGVLIAAAIIFYNSVMSRFSEMTLVNTNTLWQKTISSNLDRIEFSSTVISRDRDFIEAVTNKDKQSIANFVDVSTKFMLTSGIVQDIYVLDSDGNVLHSSSGKYVDQKHGIKLVGLATESGKVQRGIDVDVDGKIKAFVVSPLFKRGKNIGSVVYAATPINAMNELKEETGAEIMVASERRNVL